MKKRILLGKTIKSEKTGNYTCTRTSFLTSLQSNSDLICHLSPILKTYLHSIKKDSRKLRNKPKMSIVSLNDLGSVQTWSESLTQLFHSSCWLRHSESVTGERVLQAQSVPPKKEKKKRENSRKTRRQLLWYCQCMQKPKLAGFLVRHLCGVPSPLHSPSIGELKKSNMTWTWNLQKFLRHWLCTFHRC